MVQQHLPLHPLIMKDPKRRNLVAKRIKSLGPGELAELGNWSDVENLGQGAQLDSIDLDEEEIFEPRKGFFECLATLYVTLLWPENIEFRETFGATLRGSINRGVKIAEIKIDTSSFTGEGHD
jgi:hypothetical protein